MGTYNSTVNGVVRDRRDLQPDFTPEIALADKVPDLLGRLYARLMCGSMPVALKTEIQGAVEKIVIPVLNSTSSNQAAIDAARLNRVKATIFLTLVSPEFQVQK